MINIDYLTTLTLILAVSQDLVHIITQPQHQLNVVPGHNAIFTVSVSFATDLLVMAIEWHKDEVRIQDMAGMHSGTSMDTLTVISANEKDVGVYFVKVSAVRVSPSFSTESVESDRVNLTLSKFLHV